MKILSDFDGVMTDPTAEAAVEKRLFRERLLVASGGELDVDGLLAAVQREVESRPTDFGWFDHGRIAAYACEDVFLALLGTADGLDRRAASGDAGAMRLLAALHPQSFLEACYDAHLAALAETRAGKCKPLDPALPGAVEALLEQGHNLVVVSNSSTERILQLLTNAGLPAVAHTLAPDARLRIRGDARKFELDPIPTFLERMGRRFDVTRPAYRAILAQERPALVIGDVFSLDLATPLAMCLEEPPQLAPLTLALVQRPYTPPWAAALMSEPEARAQLRLVRHLGELPQLCVELDLKRNAPH